MWDFVNYAGPLYLDFVVFWPDYDFLQPKHVAKNLKFFQFALKYVVFLDGNEISIYYAI
jgi:hypothetical protein